MIAQPAAAVAEHRVGLVELLAALAMCSELMPVTLRELVAAGFVLGRELVERRVDQADGHGLAVHRLEDAVEVLASGRAAAWPAPPCAASTSSATIISWMARRRSSVSKNMCSVRQQADAFGAHLDGVLGVVGRVGVGADLQRADLVAPAHQRA